MMLRMHKIGGKWYIDLKFKLNHNYHIRRPIYQSNADLLSLEFKKDNKYKYKVYVKKDINKLCVDIILNDIVVTLYGKTNHLYKDFFDYLQKYPDNRIHLSNL